ncbi:MAG: class D sortase, partial [Oscillospiraceae bacterium]
GFFTLVAVILFVQGTRTVREVERRQRSGLQATENFLKASPLPTKNHISQSPEDAERAAQEEEWTQAAEAILTVCAPQPHKFALYDGLTHDHLLWGVARVEESAPPGTAGNTVIYGHRDSSFRCLKDIQIGDTVTVTTQESEWTYRERTEICSPEAPAITQPYDTPHLTLVTCYPFTYSGPALERFLVICSTDSP